MRSISKYYQYFQNKESGTFILYHNTTYGSYHDLYEPHGVSTLVMALLLQNSRHAKYKEKQFKELTVGRTRPSSNGGGLSIAEGVAVFVDHR